MAGRGDGSFDLRLIEPFVILADEGLHFPAAAARLGISSSALSRQVARLQHELDATLLGQDGRTRVLTPAGQRFLVHARAIHGRLQALQDSEPEVRADAIRLHLGLGTLPSIEAMITAYITAYPAVAVYVVEDLDSPAVQALQLDLVDVAVDLRDSCPPDAAFTLVERVPLGLLTSPSHPVARRGRATWTDLRDETLLTVGPPAGASWNALIRSLLARAGVCVRERKGPMAPRRRFVLPIIARGEAVTIAPQQASNADASGLAWTPLLPECHADFGLVWKAERSSAVVRDFIGFIAGMAGET